MAIVEDTWFTRRLHNHDWPQPWQGIDWVADREPSYQEVMDAWRTSCPRLPVWEDANDRGLVARTVVDGRAAVRITPAGRALLARRGRPAGR